MRRNTIIYNVEGSRKFQISFVAPLCMLAVLTLACPTNVCADNDLVIDGITTTIAGGVYRIVVVKNNGTLTVNGTLSAQEIHVINGTLTTTADIQCAVLKVNGTVTVRQNLICGNAVFAFGGSTVLGTNNIVNSLDILGTLTALGTWNVRHLNVESGGTFRVYSLDTIFPGSGTLTILSDTTVVAADGHINATGVGNDSRGLGFDWYRSATGGSSAGQGGRGYWASSADGVRPPFGSCITYEVYMGGAGGINWGPNYGGGAVRIEAENSLIIEGDITADGLNGPSSVFGGGAGGSILLRSPIIRLFGALSARGGNGGIDGGGGGGGGYIKVFYDTLDADPVVMSNIVGLASVRGGARGGYRNTQDGGVGCSYFDHMPRVEDIIAPGANATEPTGVVTFQFRFVDFSGSVDGHNDSITPRIELSTNGFNTVAYVFDQSETLSGWNQVIYNSADTAEFTTPLPLPEGAYQWRVTLRDQSLWSRYTVPQTFFIGNGSPNTTLTQDILMTPSINITGALGTRCAIDYTDNLGPDTVWHTLAIVTLESQPQMFFDTNGIAKTKRFYRLQQAP